MADQLQPQLDTTNLSSALSVDMGGPLSYANLTKKHNDLNKQLTELEMSTADLQATRDIEATKAKQKQIDEAANKYQSKTAEYQKKLDSFGDVAFQPTQDNLKDIAGLFSVVGIIGSMIGGKGRQASLSALSAMDGMLSGWSKGRADLFKQEKAAFDEQLNVIKQQRDDIKTKMDMVAKEYSIDKEKADQEFQMVLAQYNSPVLKQIAMEKGLKGAMDYVDNVLSKAVDKAVEHSYRMSEKQAAKSGVGGARSAINERFENTVLRSGNEIVRSLGLMEQIGIETGGGALGGVVGKGTITSELAANLGRSLTSEEQKAYNAAAGGMALELSYVLNSGYKPNQAQIDELRNLYIATPQDTLGTSAYKFADVAAKLRAALEVAPDYTPEQKQYKAQILDKLNKYATPEEVYERMYGQPARQEPAVRTQQKPIPTEADRERGRSNPESRQRFIAHFGVEP